MFDWFLNPMLEWMLWISRALYYLFISNGKVKICYFSRVKKCTFEGPNIIYSRSTLSYSRLGAYTYVAPDSKIRHAVFGKFCSVGPGCRIGIGRHPASGFVSTHPAFFSTLQQAGVSFVKDDYFEEIIPVNVGNDVWIGAGVTILDGVHIGNGAIIGAGALVTKNVSAYGVVGGVPAQLIKRRYSPRVIMDLEEFAWWDRSPQWLEKYSDYFRDEEAFFQLIKKDGFIKSRNLKNR